MKLHAGHIESAVVALLDYRVYTIVPNVSFGWNLRHEADLIYVNRDMYVTEVEIKISASDLRADFKKGHRHESKRIHRLVYAVPENLIDLAKTLCPKHTGLIAVRQGKTGFRAEWVRISKKNGNPAITLSQYAELLRLGCMRIWSLKHHNNNKSFSTHSQIKSTS